MLNDYKRMVGNIIEALWNNAGSASSDERGMIEAMKEWLVANTDCYVADGDDELREYALAKTDLVEPE